MSTEKTARILCVDDEPQILSGLEIHLRRFCNTVTATSAAEGLDILQSASPFAVVISDMRMPGMDGAAFLAKVRDCAPDSTRLLLTGFADVDAAAAAVNEGGIFRFLTKPCAPATLRTAVEAAIKQYRLVIAERELLEKTVCGSIQVLVDILSTTCPFIFGRATRVTQHAQSMSELIVPADRWILDVASKLFELGSVTVPEEVLKRHHFCESLNPEEQRMIDRIPAITDSFLANIPRLEPVRDTLSAYYAAVRRQGPARGDSPTLVIAANALRLAADFENLETRGFASQLALDTLRGRATAYDQELLQHFIAQKATTQRAQEVREIPLRALMEGMVLAEDVRATNGMLLMARGLKVTSGFIERTKNFGRGFVREPLRVIVSADN